MDTTKQLATKAIKQQKQNLMEQGLSKPTISDSQKKSENKGTCSKVLCEMVDDTPFMLLHEEDKDKYYIAVGKYRMGKVFDTKEAAMDEIQYGKLNWNAITFILSVIKSEIENYIKTLTLK